MSSSVHRITVREMNEIQCRRQLAVSKRRFKQWQVLASKTQYQQQRINHITQAYEQLVKAGADLAQLSSRKLTQLNNQLVEFVGTLNNEVQEVREQQLERQAIMARTDTHRQHNLAQLVALVQEKLPNEVELLAQFAQVSAQDEEQVNAIIFKALSMLTPTTESLSTAAQALLSQLTAQSKGVVEFWQSGIPQTPFAKQCEQILLMIEKLRLVGRIDDVQEAEQQQQQIASLDEGTQRHLRADSLILKLASQLKLEQQRIALLDTVEQLCDELAVFEDEGHRETIANALARASQGTVAELNSLIEMLKAAVIEAEQALVAEAQRKTVLDGLSKLGYQVHETDVKSWLNDGKVVVTHPATPGYGLELGGKQARFQAQTVALSAQRDTRRDTDVDAIWCNQHQQLQALIAQDDAELLIERALPAGHHAIKVYEVETKQQEQRHAVRQNRTRTMK